MQKKKHSKGKQNIGPIIDQKGDMKSGPVDMSKMINTQYETTWSIPREPLVDAVKMFPDNENSKGNRNQHGNQ